MGNFDFVIFMRDNMLIGGIETYIYRMIKAAILHSIPCIWIAGKKYMLDDTFKDVMQNSKINIWHKSSESRCKLKEINNSDKPLKVILITFDLFDYATAEHWKKKYNKIDISVYYFMPHFKGDTLFVEDIFKGKLKSIVNSYISTIIKTMHQNGNIRYFGKKHTEVLSNTYGFIINYDEGLSVPYIANNNFDKAHIIELSKRKKFNILTVSRFEFPHKGYIIGLIRAYGALKGKYPQITLTIIGYGEDENIVINEINKLDENTKKDINLVGAVSPDKLSLYYYNTHLNISVAGGFVEGARCGCLSIPARHYSYDCEVYGYLPDSKDYSLSEEKGKPVIPYIEDVITMSNEEYINKCELSFNTYKYLDEIRMQYVWNLDIKYTSSLSTLQIYVIMLIERYNKAAHTLSSLISVFKREGLSRPIIRKVKKLWGIMYN